MTSFNQYTDQQIKEKIQFELDRWEESTKRTHIQRIFNEDEQLPVIKLPLSYVFVRAENNRIYVQLDEILDATEVMNNNRTHESQEAILKLLRSTPQYRELKDQLETQRQTTPCVITYDGLLVDGNTRCAALKQLVSEGVERSIIVAVLPENLSTPEVINDIEVNNQLVQEVKQPYSFTNRLIWQRKISTDHTPAQLAKKMGYKREGACIKKLKKDERMLGYIEEMKSLRNDLKYAYFDDKEEVLKNLDDSLQRAASQNEINEEQQIRYTKYFGTCVFFST